MGEDNYRKLRLRFFRRNPYENGFSIEELFETIEDCVSTEFIADTITLPFPSKAVFKRFLNMFFAWKNRRDINHITGDVHYLGIILPKNNSILTIHDCGELENKKGLHKFILWLFWFYWPVKRLKYITVISEQTKIHLLKFVKVRPEKIHIIPNCLIGEYKIKTSAFNSSKPRVLQVGVTPNKNFSRIAEALEGISCTLVVLGNLPEESANRLNFLGIDFEIHKGLSRAAVSELYRNCDFLLFPSTIEGFGLPIIEAQASGIPVITSNISAMPEVAGKGACLVDPYDSTSIRKAVIKLIADENFREELVKHGSLNVQRFDPHKIAELYASIYRQISYLQ